MLSIDHHARRPDAVRSEYELLRLARLSNELDEDSRDAILAASAAWPQGRLTELAGTDTAFLVEACFKLGELTSAAQVAQRRAALGEAPTAFDDFAAQYQRLASYDFALPPRAATPRMFARETPEARPRILSLYHSSSTFQMSGYTMRTQALLASSQLDVVAMTRVGYPWAARLPKASLGKVDKSKFESISGGVKYWHRRGQVTSQTHTFSNVALGKHEIIKAICECRPDAVHAASNFVNALPALLAARACGLPFIYEMRGLWELTAGVGIPGWLESERYLLERRIETFVARNADRVMVLSEVQKRELVGRGIDASRVEVVANGHEVHSSTEDKRHALLAERCPGLREWVAGRTVVGYAGAIAVYEGLQDLVAAYAQHRGAWRDVALVIAGDGPYFQQLRAQVAALGLDESVKLLGRVPPEVADALYGIVDLCVLPRLPDLVSQLITPLKTVEILSHGKVLLTSNVGAIAEQLQRYGYGETFLAGDREDLARQLNRVLSALPELKLRYQGAAAHIAARFSWGSVAVEWDRVLAAAVAEDTRAPAASAHAAIGPLYDERPDRFLEPLHLWRRVARASLALAPGHGQVLYLALPAELSAAVRVIAIPEDGEIGQAVALGAPRREGEVVLRELTLPPPGRYNLLLYAQRGEHAAGRSGRDTFRLLFAEQRLPDLVQELRPGFKRESRDTLAFEIEHDAKRPTQLSVLSEHVGAARVALSYVPMTGATLNDNFVQRTKSKVTGTRFHYVSVAQGASELALFPRATGPLMIEMTPWADGEILENRLRQVAKVRYTPRDGSYYPALDRARVNVLIAANINETLLDGSTIWLKTLANTLADSPAVNVYVVTNAIHVSNGVTSELFGRPNVAKVDLLSSKAGAERVVDLAQQVRLIDRTSGGFDLIIVRGVDFAEGIVDKATRDRVVYYGAGMFRRDEAGDLVTDEQALRLASKCSGVIFQNGVMEDMFRSRHPEFEGACYNLVPCVEDGALEGAKDVALPEREPAEELVVYAGKLIREYGLLELLEAVRLRLAAGFRTRLIVLGNKFDRRDREYQASFEAALGCLGEAARWLPAVSSKTALAWVSRADAVWGWRHGQFETSHFEVSTKMVEAITCGAPIVLYPAPANVALMGAGYAGFAEHAEDAARALGRLLEHGRTGFSPLATQLEGRFRASRVYAPLLNRVAEVRRGKVPGSGVGLRRQSILVAGHDFRFFEDIEAYLLREGHTVTREYWKNHTTRFALGQGAAVDSADIIFCEWCLGNAAWWSQNLPPGKRLFIRVHLQELQTSHPANVDFSRVEKVIFISPHVMREAVAKFGIPPEKCLVIPISVRLRPGRRPTAAEVQSRRNRLAMVGLTPWRKRPDKALEVLNVLRQRYPELKLHLKGHAPSEYSWMGSRKDELSLYRAFFREVAALERAGVVQLSGYDDELESYYRGAGWVLSFSDFEGCHTAVAEGGAMGCLPLMTNWGGADEVYPAQLVQRDLTQVVRFFDEHYDGFAHHSLQIQAQFQRTFGIDSVFAAWRSLLFAEARRPELVAAPRS